jgi:hypothetical protein
MTNLATSVSNCNQFSDDEPYDGLDLYVAANRASEIIAAARGIRDHELEDNFVRSRIDHEAYDLVDAAIVEIRKHPNYRPTDPDFWDRVVDMVRGSVAPSRTRAIATPIESAPIATPQELTELRLKLHSNGYHPLPVLGAHIKDNAAGKRPTMTAWQTKCLTAEPHEIANWSRSQRQHQHRHSLRRCCWSRYRRSRQCALCKTDGAGAGNTWTNAIASDRP